MFSTCLNRHTKFLSSRFSLLKSFTLLELLVVLLVLGILAAIAVPSYTAVRGNAAQRAATQEMELVFRNAQAIAASQGHSRIQLEDISTALGELPANSNGDVLEVQDASDLIQDAQAGGLSGVASALVDQIAGLSHGAVVFFEKGSNPVACSAILLPLSAPFGTGVASGPPIIIEGSTNANFASCTGTVLASSEEEEEEVVEPGEEVFEGFYLASDGITVRCPLAAVGDTGVVDGTTYTKRTSAQMTTNNSATTCTSGMTNLDSFFSNLLGSGWHGNVLHWDMSSVTSMNNLFRNTSFNLDISHWDVSNVQNMGGVFYGTPFNHDISSWDVSSAQNMNSMFARNEVFDQDISSWQTGNATNMGLMFERAYSFNTDISSWDVSNVENMNGMFSNATEFNQNISPWETGSVTDMSLMFSGASAFHQPIGSWNVSNVQNMAYMFRNTEFNEDISSWETDSLTDMQRMFRNNPVFNQPIGGWNTSGVTSMREMFYEASGFNQPLGAWDVSIVNNSNGMEGMFRDATGYNQDLSSWCVSHIESKPSRFDTQGPFSNPIHGWTEPRPVWGTCP